MQNRIRFLTARLANRLLTRLGFAVVTQQEVATLRFIHGQYKGILGRYGTNLSNTKARRVAVSTTGLLGRVVQDLDDDRRLTV